MEPDFSGYATKAGLRCTDGRTITPEAFKHQDKLSVPLVWQHGHQSVDNILGHAILEARDDGIYAYGFFNGTPSGQNAKTLVEHGDITMLSIFANQLAEKSKLVLHGFIRELSLVLSGANPGAKIDQVRIAHGDDPDDVEVLEDSAIITTGLSLEHENMPDDLRTKVVEDASIEHTAEPTMQEVYDSLTDQQKTVVNFMIGAAVEEAQGNASHSDLDPDANAQQVYDALSDKEKAVVHSMITDAVDDAKTAAIAEHSALGNQEGNEMTRNVFEQGGATAVKERPSISHDMLKKIFEDGERLGSLKQAFLLHAQEVLEDAGLAHDGVAGEDYGIADLDVLFPDAVMDGNGVSIISRRMEWVQNVLSGTKHNPFSRIKSLAADLTADEARAKGYVKGSLKKEEVIKMLKRVTTPKTIYKKQKLDRDDILDITTIDIVAWLKAEMRVMLEEELARAILVSDGREADDPDKIDEDHIRPIAYDIDMYNTTVALVADFTPDNFITSVVTAMKSYKGSGQPTMYTTTDVVTPLILSKDTLGRRLYATMQELAAALRVKEIIEVEAMEQDSDLVAVVVNLADYTVGADAGGNVSMFENFDIDYNQEKYLIETRVSGALTRPKSALTFRKASGRVVTPTTPTFVTSTGVLTIPTQTGTTYVNADTNTTLTPGAQTAIAAGATVNVEAHEAAGYGFTHDSDREWSFTRDA